MAAAAASPAWLIKKSPRFNKDFNNDQEIVIPPETFHIGKNIVYAVIHHYLLDSSSEHYPEMYNAGEGYWRGSPKLWGWDILGLTHLFAQQLTLETLLAGALSHLNLEMREDDNRIFINNQLIGKRINLGDNREEIISNLGHTPVDHFLTQDLTKFHPIEIGNRDFTIDGDVIFPKGTRYGMPHNSYKVSIPFPAWYKRLGYALLRPARRKKYLFLQKKKKELTLSDQMLATKVEAEQKAHAIVAMNKAESDAEIAQLNTRIEQLEHSGEIHDIINDMIAAGKLEKDTILERICTLVSTEYSILSESDDKTGIEYLVKACGFFGILPEDLSNPDSIKSRLILVSMRRSQQNLRETHPLEPVQEPAQAGGMSFATLFKSLRNQTIIFESAYSQFIGHQEHHRDILQNHRLAHFDPFHELSNISITKRLIDIVEKREVQDEYSRFRFSGCVDDVEEHLLQRKINISIIRDIRFDPIIYSRKNIWRRLLTDYAKNSSIHGKATEFIISTRDPANYTPPHLNTSHLQQSNIQTTRDLEFYCCVEDDGCGIDKATIQGMHAYLRGEHDNHSATSSKKSGLGLKNERMLFDLHKGTSLRDSYQEGERTGTRSHIYIKHCEIPTLKDNIPKSKENSIKNPPEK